MSLPPFLFVYQGLTDDSAKKKRRFIPTEAKAVMEDYYNHNKYLSIEKRQTLANQLAIPEQCVSDYFKNLRSRKKHEERMKFLLKGLENGDRQLLERDSEAESSFEKSMNNELPCCSRSLPAEATANPEESPVSMKPPRLIQQCGRRYNVAPAVLMPSFKTASAKDVCENDIVASKIAALTKSQKSIHKQPVSDEVKFLSNASKHLPQETTPLTGCVRGHHAVQVDLKQEGNYNLSQESSSSVDTVETLSFDSLIDGSMILHPGTADTETLEVGEEIYVVHLNNHMETPVQN